MRTMARIGRTARLAGAAAAVMLLTAAMPAFDAVLGRALFERVWVGGGSSTKAADGLGPLHNARSCVGCHPRGGAAAILVDAEGGATGAGLVLRLAGPGGGPDPVYGHQIQTRGLPGQAAEARLASTVLPMADGDPGPRIAATLTELGYGPIDPETGVGLRRAPSLVGRAALASADAAAVIARADPDDADGDGVRGRARMVDGAEGAPVLGRFGWRAGGATLAAQVSSAFSIDLGLSTPLKPEPAGECTAAQPACRGALHGDNDSAAATEVTTDMIDLIEAYLASLEARPAPGGQGTALFAATGCAACHVPALAAVGGGTVPAFTDLLLHDLGPGLADPARDPGVAPGEWRTAPLVGLSAGKAVTRRFLHDGRAGSIEEAVLWHDGEAASAAARFRGLADDDRRALIDYVERL